MSTTKLPRLTFKKRGQSTADGDGWHSIIISMLRGLAAVQVAAAHLRADLYPGMRTITDPSIWFKGFSFFTGFAHHSVLVFFVISGWLVGGSLLDKFHKTGAIADYAIDRVTRLWTVLIPTFALTLLVGLSTDLISSKGLDVSPSNEYSVVAFCANLIGLQTIITPPFGGNFPLWSLANETWYYALFPLIVVAFAGQSAKLRAACTAVVLALCVLLPGAIIGYFAVWLLGVVFSRISIVCSSEIRAGWLVLGAAIWSYYRLTGNMNAFDLESLVPDMLCSFVFVVLLSSLRTPPAADSTFAAPLARVGAFFANFSFSLYVLHIPMIALLKYWVLAPLGLHQLSPYEPLHLALFFGLLTSLLAVAYVFFRVFESRTYRIRRWLKHRLLRRHAGASVAPVVPVD